MPEMMAGGLAWPNKVKQGPRLFVCDSVPGGCDSGSVCAVGFLGEVAPVNRRELVMRMRRQLVSEGLSEPVLLLQGQVPCWWPRPLVSAFMSAAWLGLDLGSLFVTSEMAKAHSDHSGDSVLCPARSVPSPVKHRD